MKGVSIQDAKQGRGLIIMEDKESNPKPQRIGFLKGKIRVPDDFDTMGQEEILSLFGESE